MSFPTTPLTMNALQTSIAVSPATTVNSDQAISTAKITEWSVLAAIAIILIRNLMRLNEKLTDKLLEELDEENK